MLHNKPFKKITVTSQTVNKEYVLAVHNPKDIDYSGVYALKLKAAGKLFRVDFSIAGDNEISHSDVNIGILNIVDNNSGIGTTQIAFNNNFTLKVVQNNAGLNLIVIRMLTVIMSGNFEMTISNSVPTGLDWSDYGKYIGKDYSTIAGYPFANETVKSPVKILGGINAPEVTTTAATSVTSAGMILNASLTTLGSEASVNVAFDWRLIGAGSWTRTSLVAKTTIGTFSATLSGLSSNTTYEYRAVVIGQSNPGNDDIGGVLAQLTVAINIDADSGVNITGTSGGSALNTTNIPSVTNGAVNNATGLMTATADNCVSQTVEIAQQVGQSDFQLLRTTFALAPYQVAIDPASNTTTLVVTDPESGKFVNNSKFWLESSGVMKLVQAANILETIIDNSNDGWGQQASGFLGTNINGIVYGNAGFVAVGGSNKLGTSSDGINWNQQTSSFTVGEIWCAAYGNGIYVAGGDSSGTGQIAISTDSINWNQQTSSFTGGSIRAICFGNNVFVAGAGNGLLGTSTNGSSWNMRASSFGSSGIYGLTYGNGIYVAVGASGKIATSTDSINWAQQTSGTSNNLNSVAYGNGVFVAVGDAGTLLRSTNGTSWSSQTSSFILDTIYSVSYGNGLFVAVGNNGKLATSSDGVNWNQQTSSFLTTRITAATCGNGVWVVTGFSGKIATSRAGLAYKYTCTSLTSLFGGAITTTPTLAYKAGQNFESSITATSGTTNYVADTLYSVSRSGNILTLIFNQRSATGRYVRSKATVNKGDVISRYAIDLWN